MDPTSLQPPGVLALQREHPLDQEIAVLVVAQDERHKTYPVVVKYIHSPRLGAHISPEILHSNVEIAKARIRAAQLNDLTMTGFSRATVETTSPPSEKLKLLHSAAEAVAYLHSRNPPIVHGNIEPSQFAVSPRGESVVLLDFGLTHALRYLQNDSNSLDEPLPLPNPGFASPRLMTAFGENGVLDVELDPFDDVFAFASTILTVMSGIAPLVGIDSLEERMHPKLPVNDSLWKLLRRMWGLDASQPTMNEVAKLLEIEYRERRELEAQTLPEAVTSMAIGGRLSPQPQQNDPSAPDQPLEELPPNSLFFPQTPTSSPEALTTTDKGWLIVPGVTMQVAVKSLWLVEVPKDPQRLERLRRRAKREFAVLLSLQNQHLLGLKGYRLDPVPAVVSPWCSTGNLLEYIEQGPILTQYQVLRLMLQVTRGILFLHSRKPVALVHGDVKPQNVVIGELGQALVCDYGLHQLLPPTARASRSPSSIRYLAPEGVSGSSAPPVDIWGLAGLFLACLSRREPFAGLSTPVILRRLSDGIAPKREEHPNLNADDPLWDLMYRCWNFRPGDRPDIYEVEADVREARDARSGKPRLQPIGAPPITLDEDHLRRQLASVAMTSASRAFPEALELTRPRDNLLAANTDDTSGRDMETSRSELGSGVKPDQQPVFSVDSTVVDPTQAPPASEAEPTSRSRQLPTLRTEYSTERGVVSSQEGASLRAKDQAGSLDPNAKEEDSLVQPGRHIPERDLPSEISGALMKIRELDGFVTKKTGAKIDGGTYADVSEGVLDRPDGSKLRSLSSLLGILKGQKRRDSTWVRREAFIWMTAKHPNILPFIGYKVVDGVHCLVSPWCKNGSLASYVATKQGIKDSEKLKLLCDAARGLAHLHSSDPVITHGDIEPNNVIVMDNLDGAICDFGISRLFVGIGNASGLTTTGNRTGRCAGYQAKELLEETAHYASTPGDVYAFGGLILATMSGKGPFWNKRNEAARIVAVCMGHTPSPKDHPRLPSTDPLWHLLLKCWSENPGKRPTMDAVLQELESEKDRRAALGN